MTKQIDDHISSDKADEIFQNKLMHHQTRQHIISIIDDYANSVPFMEKVRKYSSDEIDSRLFTSVKFWLVTIFSAVVSAAIGFIISHYWN